MERLCAGFRILALTAALALSACTSWFWPVSQSRGHLFDEAGREVAMIGDGVGQQILDNRLRREFPPGTPLSDLMPHIVGADVTCSSPIDDPSVPHRRETQCRYESRTYHAWAFMDLGDPFATVADIDWTLSILHSDGLVESYEVTGTTTLTSLERTEYLEGLARQREEENWQ